MAFYIARNTTHPLAENTTFIAKLGWILIDPRDNGEEPSEWALGNIDAGPLRPALDFLTRNEAEDYLRHLTEGAGRPDGAPPLVGAFDHYRVVEI